MALSQDKEQAVVPRDTSFSNESGEVALFCSQCGQAKGDFDMFCGRCMKPLVRRFRSLMVAEIALFLAAAACLSLATAGVLPAAYQLAPLFFLAQLFVLYLLRLYLRRRRFVVLVTVYLVLLIFFYPCVNPLLLRVTGVVGVILGLYNVLPKLVFRVYSTWWDGVLHLPLLMLSLVGVVLSMRRPEH